LYHSRVAEFPARSFYGLRGRFSARLAIARGHPQMRGDFFMQLFVALLAPAPQNFHA
jgi:hypothetical protein